MSPEFDAFLRSWPFMPWPTTAMLLTAGIYLRGWLRLRRHNPQRWHSGRAIAFLGGISAVFLALASPIEPFASLLLQLHMLQHLLLMMVAPPLLWLGWPLLPLVRGLPKPIRVYWIAPLLRSPVLRNLFAALVHPLVAWPIFVATTWLWHTPRGYELALRSADWHVIEHACFFASGLLFWYPVVRPYPSRPRWSPWLLVPYLLLADVQNTLLAAWLTFSSSVLYPHYAQVPRLGGLSALDDQAAAGVLMWVPGSIAFLLPLAWICVSLMGQSRRRTEIGPTNAAKDRLSIASSRLPIVDLPPQRRVAPAFDLLRLPIVGAFLRWRFLRITLQFVSAMFAAVLIFDGVTGPQLSPINLAGVVPWIHWRGLLIIGLLVAGNVFCMACPFTLPRRLADYLRPGQRPWPRYLRNKWLAAGSVVFFLWSYEAFALWDSPWITAWIAVGYFVGAFVVDCFFQGAAFCKYVCPIGQFNFVQSLISPWQVAVREPAVCDSCRTQECLRGSAQIPGCQMELFQPRKQSNFDCTFCLDCVHACPHANVGILAAAPGRALWSNPVRSGIGQLARRRDVAALVLVLVFGAFANAAGMVGPVVEWQNHVRGLLGNPPQFLVTTAFYILALIALPFAVVVAASKASVGLGSASDSWQSVATRYSFALVPIGFAMWFSHYSFHFFTSWDTIIPAAQRFAADRGWHGFGDPLVACACCQPAAEWITYVEIFVLDLGLLLSLYTGLRIAESHSTTVPLAFKSLAPWALLTILLFACGIWIVFQPMEMRGTLAAAG